jgi:hypothetical protein
MATDPKVAIIIPSFNGRDFLNACLSSLEGQDYDNFTVTVVDNASSDDSVALVKREYPDVRIVENSHNTGFAGGCNSGLNRELKGDARYFVLLNSDTRAEPDWLSELVKAAGSDEAIGICQSMIYMADQPNIINTAGNEAHYLAFGYCGHYLEEDTGQFDGIVDIPFASGTAMLVKREVLDKIGLMDDDLFLYQEDLDLCWRTRLAGWRIVLAPASHIGHSYSFSRNKMKMYYLERNRNAVCLKNYSGRSLLVLFPALVGAEAAMLVYSLFDGWFGQKLKGYLYLVRNLDRIRKKRAEIQGKRVIGDLEATALWTERMRFADLQDSRLTRIANPVSSLYWKLARKLIK